jgi:hypothetical protein
MDTVIRRLDAINLMSRQRLDTLNRKMHEHATASTTPRRGSRGVKQDIVAHPELQGSVSEVSFLLTNPNAMAWSPELRYSAHSSSTRVDLEQGLPNMTLPPSAVGEVEPGEQRCRVV